MKKFVLYLFLACTFTLGCKQKDKAKKKKETSFLFIPDTLSSDYYNAVFDSLSLIPNKDLNDYFPDYHIQHPREYRLLNALLNVIQVADDSLFVEKMITYHIHNYLSSMNVNTSKSRLLSARQMYTYLQRSINVILPASEGVVDKQQMLYYHHLDDLFRNYLLIKYQQLFFSSVFDTSLRECFKKEYVLWKKWMKTQRVIIDSVYQIDDSNKEQVHLFFKAKKDKILLKYYTDLYFTLLDDYFIYVPKQYRAIPQQRILKEYDLLKKDWLEEYKCYSKGGSQFCLFLEKEKEAWKNFMRYRVMLQKQTKGLLGKMYQKQTYRFQKLHLIHLKNEFKDHIWPVESYFSILQENCSYPYLLGPIRPRDIKKKAELTY